MTAMLEPLRSTATNAYDLLDDVCRAITEEPRRYDQKDWAIIRGSQAWSNWIAMHRAPHLPECGTVGCRAGWIVQLAKGSLPTNPYSVTGVDRAKTQKQAYELLGTSMFAYSREDHNYREDIDNLFDAVALQAENDIDDPPEPGTPAYAALGVAGIRTFMKKWKTRLRATPVTHAD